MSDQNQNETFQDRMFHGGQAVYERLLRGEVADVEAALMDVHLNVCTDPLAWSCTACGTCNPADTGTCTNPDCRAHWGRTGPETT